MNQELRSSIMAMKNVIIRVLLEQGQFDMVLIVLESLDLKHEDLKKFDYDRNRPSILWQACDSEHTRLAAHVLKIYEQR